MIAPRALAGIEGEEDCLELFSKQYRSAVSGTP
jgi:hypothetical protein